MKICMFTNTYLPHVGGVARSVSSFVVGLRNLEHQVLVVAPTFPSVKAGEDRQEGTFRLPAIQNFNGSDFSVRIPLPSHLAEKIDDFDPDIIHSHHPFLLGDTALRFSRSRSLPLVFTHHTLYENYTHYAPLDSQAMKRFVIHLSTEYANLCSAVIAPSRSVAQILRERGVRRKIEEIPTGVDLDLFRAGDGRRWRNKFHIPQDVMLIGHVGRLAEEKNLLFLARAAVLFLQCHLTSRLLIAGEGDAGEKVRQLFKKAGVADRVQFVGALKREELADAYQAMDLFIFSSKSETQGLVLAEAMAASTPVVALEATGVREVMVDGVNGRMLAGNATVEQFARAMAELVADPERLRALGKNALHTAQLFSTEKAAVRLADFYEKVIILHGRQPAEHPFTGLEELQTALKTEWDLLAEKIHAAVQAL